MILGLTFGSIIIIVLVHVILRLFETSIIKLFNKLFRTENRMNRKQLKADAKIYVKKVLVAHKKQIKEDAKNEVLVDVNEFQNLIGK